jgi:glutathione synthase
MIVAIQANPINQFKPETDTTWLLANEFFKRKYRLFFYTPSNLYYKNGRVCALGNFIEVISYNPMKYKKSRPEHLDLTKAQVLLIRQDPPFNIEYITTTYLLELIKDKVLIINNPTEIRNSPEKLSVLNFPQFLPPTIVASNSNSEITRFIKTYHDVVIKPIYAYGGIDVKKIFNHTKNPNLIIARYLKKYGNFILQKYLGKVKDGDKRILLFDGEIIGAFKRVPKTGEFRANMALGSTPITTQVTKRELEICKYLKPELKRRKLFFVGLDIIDNYLIEINVTSPTGLVALNALYNQRVEALIVNKIEAKLVNI